MELHLQTDMGTFACMDYGGKGRDCLLIHGTGQNAAAWEHFAQAFAPGFRLFAFDMRGHGQTPEVSQDAEQYWRDIGAITAALGMESPILIGHSTGAYAATAYAASGGQVAHLVCIDGFTLDSSERVRAEAKESLPDATRTMLFDMFRYGWRATIAERDAYIEEVVANAPGNWLNDGIDPAHLRAMLVRCFVEDGDRWLRRPTLDEIATVSAPNPNADILPSRAIYDAIDLPMLLLWADGGLSADRHEDLENVATASSRRTLLDMHGSHNLPMQQPTELARLISSHLHR